ncbi:MAG: hypothetical protein IPM39_19400 [Chloroflexi bacterium]|nr:hypothetical protein [Chloroflexota bacterium]
MKAVICLAEQQLLFAGNRLPKTAAAFKPLPDLLREGWTQPLVLVGDKITAADFKALAQRTTQNPAPLLVLPGFPVADVTALLAAPAPVQIIAQPANRVTVKDAGLETAVGKHDLDLYCIEAIETPLEVGVLATSQEKAVIWAYRPTRAATPIILITVQLLLPSARSNPLDREALWFALLEWGLANSRKETAVTITTDQESPLEADLLRAFVIAFHVRPDLPAQTLPDWLRTRLFVQVSPEQTDAILRHFQQRHVLDEAGRPLSEQVTQLINQWGLQAWVREARRIEASYER